jgi:hypothetical protein
MMIKKLKINFFCLLILLSLFSCGEEEEESISSTSGSLSDIYCLGLSEINLSSDPVQFSINGIDVEMEKSVSGNNFSLSGNITVGGGTTTLEVSSNFSSSESYGAVALSVGTPINITINGHAINQACETKSVDSEGDGADQIVTTNPIDEGDIHDISKFRSSAGHSSVDSFEACRSMKHYFEPTSKTNNTNAIYAPFDGVVTSMNTEEGGEFEDDGITNQLIAFKPSLSSSYQISFYHVDVLESLNLTPGDEIEEGTLLGYARLVRVNSDDTDPDSVPDESNDFDIKVEVLTSDGIRAISVFQLMISSVFDEYNSLTSSLNDLIISKSSRDADPLTCDGENFTGPGSLNSWLVDN